MVVVEQESFIHESDETDTDSKLLREERQRTGKYVAAGTALFLSLLGVYQALTQGTPQYAALFLPAVIMFIYVFWILYANKKYNRKFTYTNNIDLEEEHELKEVIVNSNANVNNNKPNNLVKDINKANDEHLNNANTDDSSNNVTFQVSNKNFCRTYSVA